MLPKSFRLTRSRDFSRVRRSGRSAGCSLFVLYALPTRSADLRVGFSVSKRVGKATVRNRVKRLMREAVRHQLPSIRPGQDLVFIARPAAAQATYNQVYESVCYLLGKADACRQRMKSVGNA
ncbi:MAG TPA: ribonuclease P protein component [Chloroflexi bacterium]|jgi:ribonuclease P protein component|nr:ribonuclease P protein component [Chloroflexota bacterium]